MLEKSENEMFFIAEFERAAKIRKIAVYSFLISLLDISDRRRIVIWYSMLEL